MRASGAMRLGVMMFPKGVGYLYANGKMCALGQLAFGAGMIERAVEVDAEDSKYIDRVMEQLRRKYPVLLKRLSYLDLPGELACRYVAKVEMLALDAIWRTNDHTKMTITEIADWLAGIERRWEGEMLLRGVSRDLIAEWLGDEDVVSVQADPASVGASEARVLSGVSV